MNAAVIVAIIEENFKKYLKITEYLKLDPRIIHDEEVINSRAESLLLSMEATDDEKQKKKLEKDLNWFKKYYKTLAKRSLRGYGFAKKTSRLVEKGHMQLLEGTVSDEYIPSGLSQGNWDSYSKRQNKIGLIALGVILGAALIAGIVALILLI